MTLHILNALKDLTVLDVVTTETETTFYVMSAKNIKFSDLCIIKEQLPDIKEIIVYTWESKQSPNNQECQMEIIVENKEKVEPVYQPSNSDSKPKKRFVI